MEKPVMLGHIKAKRRADNLHLQADQDAQQGPLCLVHLNKPCSTFSTIDASLASVPSEHANTKIDLHNSALY
ncbi:hypothetical protein BDE02_12G064400 [Populus trichocarpa]|nr:hypothetical protein BDE02_12G064400 [Populus trichocarpa]